jgi:hypothetical protein
VQVRPAIPFCTCGIMTQIGSSDTSIGHCMKRDLDLVRLILKEIEEKQPPGIAIQDISIDGYDRQTVYAHIGLMANAGLLNGEVIEGMVGNVGVIIRGLTWNGHDFIAAATDESIWTKTKTTVAKHGPAVTFDVLLEMLKAEIRMRLGLP